MNIVIIGSGLMGRAIAFDLLKNSNFKEITIVDSSKESLNTSKFFLKDTIIDFLKINVENTKELKKILTKNDIFISAIPYSFNFKLSKIAIETKTHFIDLGGNNYIVDKQRSLFQEARRNDIVILPDCGLAPGLVSVITKDVVEQLDDVEYVKLRVGGLPQNPKPPLNYQIVFSLNGLINEYYEDALILQTGKIVKKKSLTEVEEIIFPEPFGKMEAFITSGGCSTLPNSYKHKVSYLDYKTIRYPGHCNYLQPVFELGFGSNDPIEIEGQSIIPRKLLIKFMRKILPNDGKDVVLLRVMAKGKRNNHPVSMEYNMIDYYDEHYQISAMMRTTGYPVSIIAQMLERGMIKDRGVFSTEEIIPCKAFFSELEKRNIKIEKVIK